MDYDEEMSTIKIAAILCILFIIGTLAFGSFYTIGAGERGVLLTFGKADDISYNPGFHFKMPIVQKVVKMDVKTQKYEAEASAASKDLQVVTGKLAVNYHLLPESAPAMYKEVGIDYAIKLIQPLEQEIVKATTAKYTAEELITRREEVRLEIKNALHDRLVERGLVVEEVSIVNFDFSDSFNQAIENKVTAEQNALKELNQLKVVEYQAQQRIAQANAEATAIKIQSEAVRAQGGKEYVQLQAINKWNGQMPYVVGGGSMPFISIPGASLNSS